LTKPFLSESPLFLMSFTLTGGSTNKTPPDMSVMPHFILCPSAYFSSACTTITLVECLNVNIFWCLLCSRMDQWVENLQTSLMSYTFPSSTSVHYFPLFVIPSFTWTGHLKLHHSWGLWAFACNLRALLSVYIHSLNMYKPL